MKQRKPTRMKGHDYATAAMYFITSSVKNNSCVFGNVSKGKMILNVYGKVAEEQWHWLDKHYTFLSIPAFVVMPNHVHAIIDIHGKFTQTAIRPLPQLISAYKSRVSSRIRKLGLDSFSWHRSYYDHIIRNEYSFMNILHYIHNNPGTWQKDSFFSKNNHSRK